MTVEEKRKKVNDYCEHTNCESCLLKNHNWGTHEWLPEKCLYIRSASSDELDRAIRIINEDIVNHPSHYTDGKIEVIEFIEDKKLGFCLGNAVKYIARAGKKDPTKEVEDLKKAEWYIKRRIKELEEAIV